MEKLKSGSNQNKKYPSVPRRKSVFNFLVDFSFVLMRWLRVILRLDRYIAEESMKFGTKNLVCIINKFTLGAT